MYLVFCLFNRWIYCRMVDFQMTDNTNARMLRSKTHRGDSTVLTTLIIVVASVVLGTGVVLYGTSLLQVSGVNTPDKIITVQKIQGQTTISSIDSVVGKLMGINTLTHQLLLDVNGTARIISSSSGICPPTGGFCDVTLNELRIGEIITYTNSTYAQNCIYQIHYPEGFTANYPIDSYTDSVVVNPNHYQIKLISNTCEPKYSSSIMFISEGDRTK